MKLKSLYFTVFVCFMLGFNYCISKSENKQTTSIEEVNKINRKGVQKVDCEWCTIENVKKIRLAKGKPGKQELLNFLMCCNKSCARDVEFSEFGNYSLFILLQEHPEMILSVLYSNYKVIQLEYIKLMLENPVSDKIDLDKTLNALNELDGYEGKIKDELKSSLKIAKEKY